MLYAQLWRQVPNGHYTAVERLLTLQHQRHVSREWNDCAIADDHQCACDHWAPVYDAGGAR